MSEPRCDACDEPTGTAEYAVDDGAFLCPQCAERLSDPVDPDEADWAYDMAREAR